MRGNGGGGRFRKSRESPTPEWVVEILGTRTTESSYVSGSLEFGLEQ